MAPLDFTTFMLVCSSLGYALAMLYMVGFFLRPPLTRAINGLINLARLAVERTGSRN